MHERFVTDSAAMDKAWAAGEYDQWLDGYRKRCMEEFDGGDGEQTEDVGGEGSAELDESSPGSRGHDVREDPAPKPDR